MAYIKRDDLIFMDEKDFIKQMYRDLWRCMIDKDAGGFGALVADDYTLTHMTGVVQSKEQFIDGLLRGTFNYYSAHHDEISVSVDGDNAKLTGKSRVLAAVYGKGKHTWRLRGDFTLKKQNGAWRFCASEASTY